MRKFWEEFKVWWSGLHWGWKVAAIVTSVCWVIPMLLAAATDYLGAAYHRRPEPRRSLEPIKVRVDKEFEALDEEEEEIETAITELTEERRRIEKEVENAIQELDDCDSFECIDDLVARATSCRSGRECCRTGECERGTCVCGTKR